MCERIRVPAVGANDASSAPLDRRVAILRVLRFRVDGELPANSMRFRVSKSCDNSRHTLHCDRMCSYFNDVAWHLLSVTR
jgi:hypothetical protein